MSSVLQISILIPTRNYDCTLLVETLHAELIQSNIAGEIIVGDDCSDQSYLQIYQDLYDRGLIEIFRPKHNLGAGRMRNVLAQRASGELLLLIDSDTMPASEGFIAGYLHHATADCVVVGGFVYPDETPPKERRLRYLYGHRVEVRTLTERQKAPWDSFVSMCFLIPRHLFLEEGFSTEMGMGYEDAYFGYRLAERAIPIIHIDNPVIHTLKETDTQYLATTERYVENLSHHKDLLAPYPIRLLQLYLRLHRVGMTSLLRVVAPLLKPLLRLQLTSGHPSIQLFALYKLLHLCSLSDSSSTQRVKLRQDAKLNGSN